MLGLDVPMYLRRYKVELASGRRFFTVQEGFRDALNRREPMIEWSRWRPEAAWMTPYFTACVWLSVGMAAV